VWYAALMPRQQAAPAKKQPRAATSAGPADAYRGPTRPHAHHRYSPSPAAAKAAAPTRCVQMLTLSLCRYSRLASDRATLCDVARYPVRMDGLSRRQCGRSSQSTSSACSSLASAVLAVSRSVLAVAAAMDRRRG
jgi:hypothetical protein